MFKIMSMKQLNKDLEIKQNYLILQEEILQNKNYQEILSKVQCAILLFII